MRNNTAFNQSSPGGGSPGIHIYQRRLINPTQAEVIEQAVNADREMVEAAPRVHLEIAVGAIVAELVLAKLLDVPEITVNRLSELLRLGGVVIECGRKGPDRNGKS